MADGKFISYLRVSTKRQGTSGLGLDAQRKAVTDFLNGGNWTLLTEVVEVESGKRNDRPKLDQALRLCRLRNATLLIARLDRLSRDAAFLLNLQSAGVRFVAADMPEANEMVVGIMAVVAQAERKRISTNTKLALAAAKARGQALGGARGYTGTAENTAKARAVRAEKIGVKVQDLAVALAEIDPNNTGTLRSVATALQAEGIPTPSGRGAWTATAVARLRARLQPPAV
ncbi:recombinase family protein [Methylobacterium sp. M6A4_1b]